MNTLVIDYQLNNLGSITRALEKCGSFVTVSSDPNELSSADRVVLPGVGSFAVAMQKLHQLGWVAPLKKNQKPLLGICLGMQLLADEGEENGITAGLGIIPGRVVKMKAPKVPHVGWNEIDASTHPLFHTIEPQTDFYFVHSYQFVPKTEDLILTKTPYAQSFVSSIHYKNAFGVQFHPEKSMPAGLTLLKNFCEGTWD